MNNFSLPESGASFYFIFTLQALGWMALGGATAHLKRKYLNVKEEEVNKNQYFLLEESQHFLDSVIENIPDMIFVKDADNLKFVKFNRAGERLIGRSRKEMIGKSDFDFFPREQADFFTQKDRSVLSSGVVQDIPEEELNTKHGVRVLHTKKIPILDGNGKPKYLLGISEDITEKKRAERQALRLLEERAARKEAEKNAQHFAFLSETSKILSLSMNCREVLSELAKTISKNFADGCFIEVVEESGNIVTAHHRNQRFKEKIHDFLSFYEESRSADFSLNSSVKKSEPLLLSEVSEDVLKKLRIRPEYIEFIKRIDVKSAIWIPLMNFERTVGSIVFVISDHRRKYTALDLTIAKEVAERASFVIENTRLFYQTQEANKSKSEFLANMSHEIRTPLGAILGFAQLLNESANFGCEEKKFIETIMRNGGQLLKIVDEILDISKIEANKDTIEIVEFPFIKLIEEVTSLLRLQAMEKGLELVVREVGILPVTVRTDPTRLRQILINIIGNAIKFTARGSISLEVMAVPEDDNPEILTLKFTVTDTGIGIRPEQLKVLFRPFVQADSSMTRKFGGTGLGLYLSRKYAHMLGGDLVLQESEYGKGCSFLVTIRAQRAKPAGPVKSSIREKTAGVGGCGLKVLIVDDFLDNRILTGRLMTNMGHTVDFAENGVEGVKKALDSKYDLILMDIHMPEMNGFEAVSNLRQKGYERPIVALTAHAMKGDRERCLAGGFSGYLAKPINREEMATVIGNLAPLSN